MQILDNINNTVRDDLKKIVHRGSKMSIAAACFSIYAYQELRKQLEEIEDLEFIFTSPTFTTEKTPKAKREFYIPRLSRERSLYGTEFEVKLRNELTQKAIAKECAEWIRQKVTFKSNVTQEQMMGFMTVDQSSGKCLRFAQMIIESIYAVVLDYKSLIDANWHYLYSPSSDWAKFCKICIFLLNVRSYIKEIALKANPEGKTGYYHILKHAIDENVFEVTSIATTNYNKFIKDILCTEIAFLNGSTEIWYDPYLNRMGEQTELTTSENHILVPLMFTQSGTKPMTSIEMSMKYVDTYKRWKESDRIVVVGFGFGIDDEHINGVLRTLIDVDDKKIIVVTLSKNKADDDVAKDIARSLKVIKASNISIVQVDKSGKQIQDNALWTEAILRK